MASLEYNSMKDKPLIDNALAIICREDNSLVVTDDKENGQIIVKGLGELHLEVRLTNICEKQRRINQDNF